MRSFKSFLLLLGMLVGIPAVGQVTTAFTYQGELEKAGDPATGEFDFEFILFDAETGGLAFAGPFNVEDVFVDGGLFTTEVDFGTNVFGMMDLWLEVRVREGNSTDSFTPLLPRQKVNPAPLAQHALNVEMNSINTSAIAPGAVSESDIADSAISSRTLASGSVGSPEVRDNSLTASDIATGAVGSSEIADGAVSATKIASRAVTSAALTNPYETGIVNLESISAPVWFFTRVIERNVNFTNAFPRPPVVTTTLESQFNSAAELLGPVLLSNVGTTGFNLTFRYRTIPVAVAPKRNITISPMTEINNLPAIAYDSSTSLKFVQALDSEGLQWGDPVTIANMSVDKVELLVVAGRPAVAFNTSGGALFYARANDADGASWPIPITISDSFDISDFSLAIIGSTPAIAVRDAPSKDIGYLVANDDEGASWPSLGGASLVVSSSNDGITLIEVSNNPAVSYPWDNGLSSNNTSFVSEVRYVRADSGAGTTWGSPVTVVDFGTFDRPQDTGLHLVDGNPSIFYTLSSGGTTFRLSPFFVRATDSAGSSWDSPVDIFSVDTTTADVETLVMGGNPTIVWQDRENAELKFSRSTNGGASFATATIVELPPTSSASGAGLGASIAEINGQVAFAYTRSDISELRFIREGNPAPATSINWIAISP